MENFLIDTAGFQITQGQFLIRLLVACGIGFLIGLEREHTALTKKEEAFAGIRTFIFLSLIGFVGAAMLKLEDDQPPNNSGNIDVQVNLQPLPLILAGLGMWGVAIPLFNNSVKHEKQMKRSAVKLRSMMIQ